MDKLDENSAIRDTAKMAILPRGKAFGLKQCLKPFRLSIGLLYLMAVLLAATTMLLSLMSGPVLERFILCASASRANLLDESNQITILLTEFLGVDTELLNRLLFDYLAFAILGLSLFRFILQAAVFSGWEKIGESFSKDIRERLARGYIYLNPLSKNSPNVKDIETSITTILTTEVYTLKYYVVRYFGGIPREALQSILLLIALGYLSLKLTLIVIFVLSPLAVFLSKLSKKIKKRSRLAFDRQNSLGEWIQQRLSGIEVIKHYKSEGKEITQMNQFSQSLLSKQLHTARTSARTAPVSEAVSIVMVAVLFYITSQYKHLVGLDGTALLSYFACLAFLSQSINKLSKYTNISSTGKAALEKIRDTVDYLEAHRKEQIKESLNLQKLSAGQNHAIEIEHISYAYAGENYVLKDVSFVFEYGKQYAVVGPSGAGKSTIINLILGNFKPNIGSITLRSSNDTGPSICYLPQGLDSGYLSIGEIIAYPKDTYNKTAAVDALKKAQLWDVLARKDIRIDEELGFGVKELSGGEWQRLNLARVFYHKADIIIADEATSALDPNTETFILKEFAELATLGCCVVHVAHRRSVIEQCDKILELRPI